MQTLFISAYLRENAIKEGKKEHKEIVQSNWFAFANLKIN